VEEGEWLPSNSTTGTQVGSFTGNEDISASDAKGSRVTPIAFHRQKDKRKRRILHSNEVIADRYTTGEQGQSLGQEAPYLRAPQACLIYAGNFTLFENWENSTACW
jgi:hypothetical protein